jgi:hypothetical protein
VCNAMAIVSKFCPQVLQVCACSIRVSCKSSGNPSRHVKYFVLRDGTAVSAAVPCTHTGRAGLRQEPLHVHN